MVDLINLVQTLTTPHPLDRYLELVRSMLTAREMRAEVVRVDRSVPGTVSLSLRPTRQWSGLLAASSCRSASSSMACATPAATHR